MKIILSRKGFDSGYGGMPSAFVRGGEMVSFPIPHDAKHPEKDYEDSCLIRYNDIPTEKRMSLQERINQLRGKRKPFPHDQCHYDPDLRRGIFGQSGPAQSHLRKRVVEGDLFLFFGWFQEAEWRGDTLHFCNPERNVQALFGFLQIGEILQAECAAHKYPDFQNHPHLTDACLEWSKTPYAQKHHYDNTVYIATKRLSLPGVKGLRGHGIFRHSPELVLTADGAKSRTIWKLPDIFRNREITYHSKKSWRPDGLFQSRPRGQEFIVFDDEDETVSKWAAKLIHRLCLHS